MKKLVTLIIVLGSFCSAFSQNTDYYDRMEHVFGNINKSKVTTGYLKEFGIRFSEVEAFNGVIASNNQMDETRWRSLYNSLYTMRVGTVAANMITPKIVFTNLETQKNNNPGVVLLAAQHYNYQQYKTNAYTNGDVTVSNERIYDVAGRNPYDTKTVFALMPLQPFVKSQNSSFTFKLPSTFLTRY